MHHIAKLFVCAILVALHAWAQVDGRLSGTVVDPTGASVPGAKASLYLPGVKTAALTTATTSDGNFDFAAVRPDYYTLVIESAGFAKYSQVDVKVDAARQTTLPPIQLSLATSAQTVEVSGSGTGVDTTTAEVATTVSTAQIANLPVLDRQVSNLFVLQAGVSANGRANTVINGMRPTFTNLLVEGVNIQDSVRTNDLDYVQNKLTVAQVAEFTVSTTNTSPTIGGAASTISLLIPSGGNQYHGSLYWYNRNGFLSANDWFNNKNGQARPFLNLNQPGGTIGGPIFKDKLFFYANYEAFRQRQNTPVTNTILTPTARQGILQYKVGGVVQQFDVLKAAGLQINPFMQGLLSQVPTTGNSNGRGDGLNTTGYAFNARGNEDRDNVTAKVDYNLSTKHVFSGSYVWNRDIVDRPDQGPFYTVAPPIFNDNHVHFMSASWRWTPTANLTNELRGGFNLAPGTFNNRQKLPPYFVIGNTSVAANIATSSLLFSSPIESGEVGEGRNTNYYSLQDNAQWVHSKHTVSFGFQMFQTRVGDFLLNGTIPTYTLGLSTKSPYGFNAGSIPGASSTDIATANNLLTTLAGLVTSGTQTFNPTTRTSGFVPGAPSRNNFTFNNYAAYALDNYKILRRLTLTLGLRWDYFPPVDESNSLLIEPRLINNNPITTLLGNATLDFAGNSVGRPLYKKDLNNFAPNIALAWDVFGDGRTSIRTGYNIAYLNDNALNDVYNSVAAVNNGLTTSRSLGQLVATADAPPAISTPPFQVPTTTLDQFNLSPSSPPVEGIMDPNLVMPYVQQWTFGIEHELKGFVLEGRYVGNHVSKIYRQIDFNQVNINQGFLPDFIRARTNGFLAQAAGKGFVPAYDPSIQGSQQLTFFPQLPAGGALTNATVLADLRSGEVGTLAQLYQSAQFFPSAGFSYFPNPYLLYSSMLTNFSNSTYNGLQLEVRKRTKSGFQFQANYTFSKALTDTFLQRGIEALLDNNNPGAEKAPANFNQTHAFKLNHYYPLPFGPGQHFNPSNPILRRVAEGWGLSGFLTSYSGNPVAIYSARGTLNRGARSAYNTVDTNMTLGQLQALTGVFMTGNGPYWFNPANIGPDARGVAPDGAAPFAGQVFFNPPPGTIGSLQRRVLNAPWYNNYNFAVSKIARLTERQSLELHADFYNLFNHPNFFINDQNVNNANFGRITQQFYSIDGVGPRLIQFGLYYKF
ncbi:MAG TPA: carboxypeptidase-like regulatory domain-containing protein [Bryobacteraceae bacterium]|nr:carboxypeptidase-like regulatory domain-containing protein [Bryobacteraceae bacterium]